MQGEPPGSPLFGTACAAPAPSPIATATKGAHIIVFTGNRHSPLPFFLGLQVGEPTAVGDHPRKLIELISCRRDPAVAAASCGPRGSVTGDVADQVVVIGRLVVVLPDVVAGPRPGWARGAVPGLRPMRRQPSGFQSPGSTAMPTAAAAIPAFVKCVRAIVISLCFAQRLGRQCQWFVGFVVGVGPLAAILQDATVTARSFVPTAGRRNPPPSPSPPRRAAHTPKPFGHRHPRRPAFLL